MAQRESALNADSGLLVHDALRQTLHQAAFDLGTDRADPTERRRVRLFLRWSTPPCGMEED